MLLASVGGLNESGTQLYYVHAAAKDRLRPDSGPQPDIEFGGATVRDEIADSLNGVGDWRVFGCVGQVGGARPVRSRLVRLLARPERFV